MKRIIIIALLIPFCTKVLSQVSSDSTITKSSQKKNKITLNLTNETENSNKWVWAQNDNHLLSLKRTDASKSSTSYKFKERGIPGKTQLVFNNVTSDGKVAAVKKYNFDLKVSYKTKVHKIIMEHGDIAEIMEMFGVKRAGSWGLRKFLTRILSVKMAAKVHKVKPDKFLEMVQSAIDKKQSTKQ